MVAFPAQHVGEGVVESTSYTAGDKTIRNNVSNILVKLQVAGRAEAIVRARDAGLGRPG